MGNFLRRGSPGKSVRSIEKRSVGSTVRCYFLAGLSLASFLIFLSPSSLCYQYLMGVWRGLDEMITFTMPLCARHIFLYAGGAAVNKTNCITSVLVHKQVDKLIYDSASCYKDYEQGVERRYNGMV